MFCFFYREAKKSRGQGPLRLGWMFGTELENQVFICTEFNTRSSPLRESGLAEWQNMSFNYPGLVFLYSFRESRIGVSVQRGERVVGWMDKIEFS
jgi:hypothetical protein